MYAIQDSVTGDWTVESLPSFNGSCTSIDLNSQGEPCIANLDEDSGYWFIYNGQPDFTGELIAEEHYKRNWISLVIDSDDKAHVAYITSLTANGIEYAVRTGSDQWERTFVDTIMSTEHGDVSLALRSNGLPGISYNVNGELRYAAFDATDTGPWAQGTSLAYDIYDHPHIAYCSPSEDSLMYAVDHGYGWQTEIICGIGGSSWGDPDMALDSMGRPHISFNQSGDIAYVFNDEPLSISTHATGTLTSEITSVPNPFSTNLNISISSSSGIQQIL